MIKLMYGDCLEKMKLIPDKSIDLILTDPPYGTTACKWDSVIPFEPMWKQIKRIRKEKSAVVLFGSEPFSSHLRMSNIKEFKYDWIWFKEQSVQFTNAKLKPMSRHEIISVFSDGVTANGSENNMVYYPQELIRANKTVKTSKKSSTHQTHNFYRDSHSLEVYREFTRYPNQDIYCSRERGFHPTQKPVALLEYLIKTYTLEGETVLDFTMGSGSTGIACLNTNRNFIGIEKDGKYFDVAKNRIHNHYQSLKGLKNG